MKNHCSCCPPKADDALLSELPTLASLDSERVVPVAWLLAHQAGAQEPQELGAGIVHLQTPHGSCFCALTELGGVRVAQAVSDSIEVAGPVTLIHATWIASCHSVCCKSVSRRATADGQVFEDTRARGKPIVFLYGGRPFTGGLCKGVEEAMASMRAGQPCTLLMSATPVGWQLDHCRIARQDCRTQVMNA